MDIVLRLEAAGQFAILPFLDSGAFEDPFENFRFIAYDLHPPPLRPTPSPPFLPASRPPGFLEVPGSPRKS